MRHGVNEQRSPLMTFPLIDNDAAHRQLPNLGIMDLSSELIRHQNTRGPHIVIQITMAAASAAPLCVLIFM